MVKIIAAAATAFAIAPTAMGLKVAFLGDSEAGSNAQRNYQLARDAGCDMVFQNGDFDYNSDPSEWESFLNNNIGDMLFLATSGNHEDDFWSTFFSGGKRWETSNGYKERFFDRLQAFNAGGNALTASCNGRSGESLEDDYGNYMNCRVGDVQFVSFGWTQFSDGTSWGGGDRDEVQDFMEESLRNSDATWKIVIAHRPEGAMNPGNRHTGNWGTQTDLNIAAKYGAMLSHGHTHVYARSKLITNFFSPANSVSPDDDADQVQLGCGQTISVINGMGGTDIDSTGGNSGASYLQKQYTSNTGSANNGILICDFGEAEASCEFKIGTGTTFDSFTLLPPPASSTCRSTVVQTAPESATPIVTENSPSNVALVGGIGAALALVTVGAVLVVRRRRATSSEEKLEFDSELGVRRPSI